MTAYPTDLAALVGELVRRESENPPGNERPVAEYVHAWFGAHGIESTLLGRLEGIYAEPAGAAPIAGIRTARERGIVGPDETVVAVVTGTGLKDTASAREATDGVTRIEPALAEVSSRYDVGETAVADGGEDTSPRTDGPEAGTR